MFRLRTFLSTIVALAPVSLVVLGACAEGGTEERLTGEVTLAETHGFFGVVATPGFQGFPVSPGEADVFDGDFSLDSAGNFTIGRNGAAVSSGTYALRRDGDLVILIPRTGQASVAWEGAYGLEGDTGRLFLADRFGNIGLYLGTRETTTAPDLAGDWTLMSLQVQFASSAITTPAFSDVGRALLADLTLTASSTPGVDFDAAGNGTRSIDPAAGLAVTGTVSGLEARGTSTLALDYGAGGTAESRTWSAGGDANMVLGAEVGTPREVAGITALVRKLAQPVDPSRLEGDWFAGVWTVFPLPERSGTDAAFGSARFTVVDGDDDTFRIEARSNTGVLFAFSGTFAASTDPLRHGQIELTESRFGESWIGAVDEGSETIVILDRIVENRAAGVSPELNLIVLVRADRDS